MGDRFALKVLLPLVQAIEDAAKEYYYDYCNC